MHPPGVEVILVGKALVGPETKIAQIDRLGIARKQPTTGPIDAELTTADAEPVYMRIVLAHHEPRARDVEDRRFERAFHEWDNTLVICDF